MRAYVPVSSAIFALACGVAPESPTETTEHVDDELLPDICSYAPNAPPSGLVYSGKTAWEASTGRLAFLASGAFPEGTTGNAYREFHYRVPSNVQRVVICKNVRVTGAFVVDHDLTIRGRDRATSVIYGTDTRDWAHSDGKNLHPWEYPAIGGSGSGATITVRNLTIRNTRSYAISGWDQRIDVQYVSFVHDRPNDQNGSNSDGVQGADGSVVRDSYFNVGDDAIKLYNDLTVENVVIDVQHNGAPIQLGWDRYGSRTATGTFKNLTIRGASADGRYNMPAIAWVSDGGAGGTKTLAIAGLTVTGFEAAERWTGSGWEPYPLVSTPVRVGTLNATITHALIAAGKFGKTTPSGTFNVCGATAQKASYDCR